MKWSGLAILFSGACALLAGPAWAAPPVKPAANLTIRVENVLPEGGVLRLGIYDEAGYPDDNAKPIASADVAAVPGETVITFHALAPGIYAIETFEDVNSNGKMDTSWIGWPLEPFGFSQDARPFLSKPSFDEAKFTLAPGENGQVIHLQNLGKRSAANKARDTVRARQGR